MKTAQPFSRSTRYEWLCVVARKLTISRLAGLFLMLLWCTMAHAIGVAPTTTTLASLLNPSAAGQFITITATVTGTGTPTGTVTFLDNGTSIGTGTLNAAGLAALTTSLAVGSHPITAQYGGDTNFAGSTSTLLTQAVNTAPAVLGGGPAGISARVIVADPHSPSTIYAGGPGLFKSTDGGLTWTSMNNGLTNTGIFSLAIDPSTTSTMYAGTGGGVFKSTNGGVTWTGAYSGLPGLRTSINNPPTSANGVSGTIVSALVIDLSNTSTIYAVVSNPVPGISGNLGRIYKSTNGGVSWASSNTGLEGCTLYPSGPCTVSISVPGLADTFVESLGIDPTNSQTLYAGTLPGGVFKSTNGGANWSSVNSAISNTATQIDLLVTDPINSGTAYAVAVDNIISTGPNGQLRGTNSGIYKTTDGGTTWDPVDTGLPTYNGAGLPPGSILVGALAIDPSNPSTVYSSVRGTNSVGADTGDVFKSTNGGATWTPENSGLTAQVLAINPSTTSTIYAGTAGGIFESTNGGTSWTSAFKGIAALGVNSVAVDPHSSPNVYAATNGGLFKSANGGATSWAPLAFSPVPSIAWSLAIDPTNPATIYTAYSGLNGIYKSANGGLTWSVSTSGFTSISLVNAIVVDPSNSAVVYAATQDAGVLKSTDGGDTWSNSGLTYVNSLAIDPTNTATLYANVYGTPSPVYKSMNGGASWTASSSGITVSSSYPNGTALAIDPSNPTTLYFGGIGGTPYIFKTTNGGQSWSAANSGIPNGLFISSLAINPANDSIVFAVANGSGIFKSTDGGASWTASNSGLPSLAVSSLAIDPSNPTMRGLRMQACSRARMVAQHGNPPPMSI